jgi:hypothetical protein
MSIPSSIPSFLLPSQSYASQEPYKIDSLFLSPAPQKLHSEDEELEETQMNAPSTQKLICHACTGEEFEDNDGILVCLLCGASKFRSTLPVSVHIRHLLLLILTFLLQSVSNETRVSQREYDPAMFSGGVRFLKRRKSTSRKRKDHPVPLSLLECIEATQVILIVSVSSFTIYVLLVRGQISVP